MADEEVIQTEPEREFKGYPSLVPLLYLAVIAVIAGAFHKLGVPVEATMLIVGAGLTRVKVSK